MKIKFFLVFTIFFLVSCSSSTLNHISETHSPQLTPSPTKTKISSTITPSYPTLTNTVSLTSTYPPMPTATPMTTRIPYDQAEIISDFEAYAYSLVWSPDSKTLFAGTDENGLFTIDPQTKKIINHAGIGLTIQCLAMSPDGETLAAGISQDGSIRLIDPQDITVKNTIFPAHNAWVQTLSFSPDGKYLVSGGDDGRVVLWDAVNGTMVKELLTDGEWIWSTAFTPDGTKLIAGSNISQKFWVWETTNWEIVQTFDGDQAAEIAFNQDGSKFVSAGGTFHEANIWDLENEQILFNLWETPGWTYSVVYGPNDSFIASAGVGEIIIFWDPETGLPIRELYTGGAFIQSIAISPDGKWLASSGSEFCYG